MKNIIFPLLAIWLSTLTGCYANNFTPTPSPIPQNTAAKLVTKTAIPFLSATQSPISPTATLTASSTSIPPTPTKIIPPEARLKIRQLRLYNNFPKGYQREGYLVLLQTVVKPEVKQIPVVIDLTTLDRWQVDLPSRLNWVRDGLGYLSPDEKWIIHLKNLDAKEPDNLLYEVVSTQGEVQRAITLPWDWDLRQSWLNDHQILADKRIQTDEQVKIDAWTYQTMVIEPVAGRMRLLPFDYPGIQEDYPAPRGYFYPINSYDPSLTYVVYPGNIPNSPPGFVLRDVLKRKNILATFPAMNDKEPAWSPDSRMFVVNNAFNIYGAWVNGKVKAITHLDQFNGEGVIASSRLFWSYDNSRIAFTISPSLQPGVHPYEKLDNCLAILDVDSESVTAHCIAGYNVRSILDMPIVWSSNHRMLLVQAHPPDFVYDHCYLMDVEEETAIDLGEFMEPLYFINSLPVAWAKK